MQYLTLGPSGLKVSSICLGMMSFGSPSWRPWVLDKTQAKPIVRRAVESGIMFFDTANVYSHGESEIITGKLLSELFHARDDYVLATKVNSPMGPGPNDRGLSRKAIIASLDASLTRLNTDYVDMYYIHRWDTTCPIEETLGTLADLVQAGKARYLGASSMFAWQFAKAQFLAKMNHWPQFIVMQNHYNLLYREEEREMIPLCQDLGVGVMPWSPLARGRLAGSRNYEQWQAMQAGTLMRKKVSVPADSIESGQVRAITDTFGHKLYSDVEWQIVDALRLISQERSIPMAQVALAWLLNKQGVTAPVVGATNPGHVDDAVAAIDLTLTNEENERLEQPYKPQSPKGIRL